MMVMILARIFKNALEQSKTEAAFHTIEFYIGLKCLLRLKTYVEYLTGTYFLNSLLSNLASFLRIII